MEKKKTKKIRSKSIAKRLNFALISRKFLKNLVIDILAVCVIIVSWCVIVENQNNESRSSIRNRRFDGVLRIEENLSSLTEEWGNELAQNTVGEAEVDRIKENLPFAGINYSFEICEGENVWGKVSVNAAVILTMSCVIFILLFVFQLLEFIIGTISGSGVIRRYLKPIDDIAIMAEQLSSEENRVSRETVSAEIAAEENAHDDTDISSEELSSLAYAIDSIDDSCKRIDIHDTELSGLEAAVNNMLRRLEEGKRRQIRFVDDASHELRTPIAVIQGYANMLDRWGKNDPEIMEEAITAIKNESEHMKVLIDQLLFLARGEMDRHVLEKKTINACAVMEEIYDESMLLEADLPEEKRHEFDASELYCAADSCGDDSGDNSEADSGGGDRVLREYMISADEAMIKQGIRILRDNALKYTPPGGLISFKVYSRAMVNSSTAESPNSGEGSNAAQMCSEKVCIEVGDTGIGIPKSELPRIFDRFYRGTNARSDNSGGSGLGLSIARWIVENHGGAIEAISGSGFGTKMTIVLDKSETGEVE